MNVNIPIPNIYILYVCIYVSMCNFEINTQMYLL